MENEPQMENKVIKKKKEEENVTVTYCNVSCLTTERNLTGLKSECVSCFPSSLLCQSEQNKEMSCVSFVVAIALEVQAGFKHSQLSRSLRASPGL